MAFYDAQALDKLEFWILAIGLDAGSYKGLWNTLKILDQVPSVSPI